MPKIKTVSNIWDHSSKKAKKVGSAIGAAGTLMCGTYPFDLPKWIGISGFVMMVVGALVANFFSDDGVQ